MSRHIQHIVPVLLLLLSLTTQAKQQPTALTVEQRQQFTYYWYAARQAITEERFADAYALLQFCNALNPHDGQTLTFLGVLYQGIGNEERALEAYKKAFETDPRDQWYKYSTTLLEKNTDESREMALKAMEKAYKEQKAAKTVDEDLLEQLKRLYITEEMWKKALAMQDELDKIKGFDGYSALTRYRVYAMWHKPKKAIEAIDKYLEIDPTDLRFLYFRLELMEQTGAKQKDLYEIYERILAIAPYNLTVLNNYAYHLATHGGDLTKAEKMSQITIREEPNNAIYLDTYGWILHLKGQDELALFYLNRAAWNATEGSKDVIQQHIVHINNEKKK